MDWLNAIGGLSRLTAGSVYGLPISVALMLPMALLLLAVQLREGSGAELPGPGVDP